ncbi:MAG: hypothetical protein ABFS23_02245 [Pseudomonadota bacterium]
MEKELDEGKHGAGRKWVVSMIPFPLPGKKAGSADCIVHLSLQRISYCPCGKKDSRQGAKIAKENISPSRDTLINPPFRHRPESMYLILLDPGIRRDDEIGLNPEISPAAGRLVRFPG